jgi:two-component system, OmpR family, sensor kinase
MRRFFSSLRFRIFAGLVLCLLVAGGIGLLTERTLREDDLEHPARTTAKTIQTTLESVWVDESARMRALEDARRTTGLELRLLPPGGRDKDGSPLPGPARRALRREVITFGPEGDAYIPILQQGDVVALVTFRSARGAQRPFIVILTALLIALGLLAYLLSRRLTTPLEKLAQTARAFGEGKLSARVGGETAQASREVADVAHAFDQMAARIEHIVLDQRALLQAISHELRSPLGRARVSLELARDRSPDPALDKIENEIANVDTILSDLLLAARSGLSETHKELQQIEPWLRSVITSNSADLIIELENKNTCSEASFDRALLTRALANLISNAARHGHPKEIPLRIVCTEHEGLEIAVHDQGPGFSAIERAFEPFERGDPARAPSRNGGSGLGLALVRRIAEAHGGQAGAENTQTQGRVTGARVWIRIPL